MSNSLDLAETTMRVILSGLRANSACQILLTNPTPRNVNFGDNRLATFNNRGNPMTDARSPSSSGKAGIIEKAAQTLLVIASSMMGVFYLSCSATCSFRK